MYPDFMEIAERNWEKFEFRVLTFSNPERLLGRHYIHGMYINV